MLLKAQILTLLAVVAVVFMATISSATAFTRFVAKGKATIQGKAVTPQKIKTSFGVVECSKFTGVEEGVEKEDSEKGRTKDKNEGCTFTPAKEGAKETATVSEDEIEANDKTDGSETDKQTKITTTNCKIVIGSGDKQEKSVVFEDTGKPVGDLLAKSLTKNVPYTGSGALCTGEGTNGEFEGTTEARDPTGTIGVSEGNFVTDTKGKIKDKNLAVQVFKGAFGAIECSTKNSKGETPGEKFETVKQAIVFEECKALGEKAKVSEGKYLFGANGSLETENAVITEVGACVVEIPSGQKFANALTYENNGSNLKGKISVEGVLYKGKGGLCAGEGKGMYTDWEEIEGNKPPEKINVE